MTSKEKTINAGRVEILINPGRQSLEPFVLTRGCSMEKHRFTWFDTSSLCEAQKVYTGNKQDCIERFKKDNPSVKLSRVVVDKLDN